MKEHQSERTHVHSALTIVSSTASIPRRTLAYLVDMAVVGVIFYLVFIFGIILGTLIIGISGGSKPVTILVFGTIMLISLTLSGTYFVYHEKKSGATPGKKILGLRVISTNGKPLTVWQCILRDLLRMIDAAMIVPGLLCMLLNKDRKRIGDYLSGTKVIHSRHQERQSEFLYLSQDDYWKLYELYQPTPVSQEVRSEILKKAFRIFIQKTTTMGGLSMQALNSSASKHLRKDLNEEDPLTISLFFAEYCFQLENSELS